jgi:hypothetical protein
VNTMRFDLGNRNKIPPLAVTDAAKFVYIVSVRERYCEPRTTGANAIACCA